MTDQNAQLAAKLDEANATIAALHSRLAESIYQGSMNAQVMNQISATLTAERADHEKTKAAVCMDGDFCQCKAYRDVCAAYEETRAKLKALIRGCAMKGACYDVIALERANKKREARAALADTASEKKG